jgi:hypothetical protein
MSSINTTRHPTGPISSTRSSSRALTAETDAELTTTPLPQANAHAIIRRRRRHQETQVGNHTLVPHLSSRAPQWVLRGRATIQYLVFGLALAGVTSFA